LFGTAALARQLGSFWMARFTFPHQGVVDSTEGGNIVGTERTLLAPRRRANPVGTEQHCIIDSGHCWPVSSFT